MSTQEVNMSSQFKVNDGYIRSVSLVFYSSHYGFLLCDEFRKQFPDPSIKKMNSHLIGGKVDMDDKSALWCGLRELIEETEFYLNGRNKLQMIRYLAEHLSNAKLIKYDECVSVQKKLYNRTYVISLDRIENKIEKDKIFSFFLNWKKHEKSTLDRIYFWNKGDETQEKTSLLQKFVSILPNPILLA